MMQNLCGNSFSGTQSSGVSNRLTSVLMYEILLLLIGYTTYFLEQGGLSPSYALNFSTSLRTVVFLAHFLISPLHLSQLSDNTESTV